MCCYSIWKLITELCIRLLKCISNSDVPWVSLGESWGKFWRKSLISLSGGIGSGSGGFSKFFLFFWHLTLGSLGFSRCLSLRLGSLFFGSNLSLILTNIWVFALSEFKFSVRDLSLSNSFIIVLLFSGVNPESLFHWFLDCLNGSSGFSSVFLLLIRGSKMVLWSWSILL